MTKKPLFERTDIYAAMSKTSGLLIEEAPAVEDRADIYAAMAEDSGKVLLEDASIYAAMLDDEDDAVDAKEAERTITAPFGARHSVPVLHAGQTVDAATVAYVQSLERALQQQKLELRKLDRTVKTLGFMVRNQRDHANATARSINDVRRDLDNKIDRRD